MRELQIKEFAKVKGGKRLPKGHSYAEDKTAFPYLRVTDFGTYTIENIEKLKYLKKETQDAIERYTISKDDLYISIAGTIGRVGYIPNVLDGANLTENAAKITEIEGFELKYLVFYLASMLAQTQIALNTKATSQPKLALYRIEGIRVPLAPLPEQRAIVAKIEQLFSELDNGIANLKAAKDKLDIYRQAVLKKAFEGELTKEWRVKNELDEWREVPITELGNIVTGNTPSKKNEDFYSSGEYNFYKPTDLEGGNIVSKSIDSLSLQGFESGRQAPKGSILVTCIGATIGKTGLIKKGGCFNQQINAIIPFEGFDPKFIYYQAIGIDFQTQIKTNASATTLPILNKGKFSKLKMSICSMAEQTQIVQEIESRLSVCDNILANIEEGLEKSEALRQSILKQAFEGKLLSEEELESCRKEPDWEPAEKLLERIKNEKPAEA